jgi:hypothetical protein
MLTPGKRLALSIKMVDLSEELLIARKNLENYAKHMANYWKKNVLILI